MWTVLYTEEFEQWFSALTQDEQESVAAMIKLLQSNGPHLPRPYADTLKGSRLKNLKELRIQHKGDPYRALYVFDPLRQAVLLCGGNKTGDKRFYERMIVLAEAVYQQYLMEMKP